LQAGRKIEEIMNRFIANSTASKPLGIPTGRKSLVVKSGQYLNRIAVIYAASATNIALVWADPPYTNFSTPVDIVTNAADKPFDVYMSDSGDIYLSYTIATSFDLGFVKLTHVDGEWSVGTPITVYDGDENYHPNIRKLSNEYIWIAYTRISSGSHYISAKCSTDEGESWGTVSNPGDTLTTGATEAYAAMTEAGEYHYIFYSEGGNKIGYRRKLNTGTIWNSEVILASGSGYDEQLAVAVDIDAKIGIAYTSSAGLKFREYSGSSWSGEFNLYDDDITGPITAYHGGIPYVLFGREYGANMNLVQYTKKANGIFQGPSSLDNRKSYLQKLLVYSSSAGSYQDKTMEAATPDAADLFHSGTGSMVAVIDDAVYVGKDAPFHLVNFILSTAGSGGEVVWKYWDGQAWKNFTPASGPWHFSTTQRDQLLWEDFHSMPGDWQKKTLSGETLYWISITVTTAFTTAPVGSQVSAISNLKALSAQG
jgi:hypothetical protein